MLHGNTYVDDVRIDEELNYYWVPLAEANDLILVFPQVNGKWDVGIDSSNSVEKFPNKTYLTVRGF